MRLEPKKNGQILTRIKVFEKVQAVNQLRSKRYFNTTFLDVLGYWKVLHFRMNRKYFEIILISRSVFDEYIVHDVEKYF